MIISVDNNFGDDSNKAINALKTLLDSGLVELMQIDLVGKGAMYVETLKREGYTQVEGVEGACPF